MNTSNENTTPRAGRSGVNRAVAAGVAVGALGGAAVGLVFGVPGLTSAASGDAAATPAAVIQQSDETPPVETDGEQMGTHLREALQPLVDDGTITAEQADAVTTQLIENRPDRGAIGEGRGPGGRHGFPGRFGAGVASEALTDLLGLDAQELRQQLRDGATLAEIATAQGVDPQAVVDELVGELDERVTNAVENGRLDQADADQKLADAEAKISDMVTNGRPDRPTDTED